MLCNPFKDILDVIHSFNLDAVFPMFAVVPLYIYVVDDFTTISNILFLLS